MDATEAVQTKVKEKIDNIKLPGPISDAAKKIGSKAAGKIATPSVVAQKMSEKMPKKMPEEMGQKGLTVQVETVFLEGM